jgi:redox-sensitive bicupin YhaK (pirin superfamily)
MQTDTIQAPAAQRSTTGWRLFGAMILLLLTLATFGMLPSAADDPPISMQPLTPRSVFTDDVSMQIRYKLDGRATGVLNLHDPSRLAIARFELRPGAHFPWHTHPGAVVVIVTEGELVYVNADDCVPRPYGAGAAFVDPGHGNVHTAFNPQTGALTVLHAVFLDAPPDGEPVTQPVGPAAAQALDTKCGVTTTVHAQH